MNERKPRRLWSLLTAALIGLPVMYVASFGPACGAAWHGYIPREALRLGYWPVIKVGKSNTPTRLALLKWIGCFDGDQMFFMSILK